MSLFIAGLPPKKKQLVFLFKKFHAQVSKFVKVLYPSHFLIKLFALPHILTLHGTQH